MSMVPGTTSWLARIDGQPAGGGLLLIHDGLALICGDGTLPSYRHRGYRLSCSGAAGPCGGLWLRAGRDLYSARQWLAAQRRAAGFSSSLCPDDADSSLS